MLLHIPGGAFDPRGTWGKVFGSEVISLALSIAEDAHADLAPVLMPLSRAVEVGYKRENVEGKNFQVTNMASRELTKCRAGRSQVCVRNFDHRSSR